MAHSFATSLLEASHDIRTILKLLGHTDVRTTMIYTYALNRGPGAIISQKIDFKLKGRRDERTYKSQFR
ncbi:MAG: tyrosine-type recombinase/integrase [Cyanobacteriota bacterium]